MKKSVLLVGMLMAMMAAPAMSYAATNDVQVTAPVKKAANTTTQYFTAADLRAEIEANGKALIGIANVTSTGNKYINGPAAGNAKISEDNTAASIRAPYEDEVVEVLAANGGYVVRRADAAEGEGYFGLSGNALVLTDAANAVVWQIAGPGENGFGGTGGFDDIFTDIDKSYNDHMVRLVYNGQFLNGQGHDSPAGLRGGTGAWSFNYIYNANYGKEEPVADPAEEIFFSWKSLVMEDMKAVYSANSTWPTVDVPGQKPAAVTYAVCEYYSQNNWLFGSMGFGNDWKLAKEYYANYNSTLDAQYAEALRIWNNYVEAPLVEEPEVVVEDYPINWDKDTNLTFTRGGDRQTSSVSITVNGEEQTIDVMEKSNVVYRDFSNQAFVVEPGAEIVPSMAYAGQWMHGYVYLDTNNNGAFDVTSYDDQNDELVAFSFYSPNDGSYGVNGIGEQKSNNCNVNPMNAFTAPTEPGEYRMRYIIDWNCIDPAGQYGSNYSGNYINANGGVIVDVTLKVEAPVPAGPQPAFTLTNLSSEAANYSFPIEVPAEYAAPVLAASATTTVIEFTKTAGSKAAFVASTDDAGNFYSNITLQDNRLGFDYTLNNGSEGWFTKTQAPYTNLNTTVRVAFTQNEETGLLNWYDAETGQQINSTNVSSNSAWGARSFGTNGYNHLYVGGFRNAAGAAQYVFPGEIASVRVFAQELTTDELVSLSWEGLQDSFDYIPEAPAFDYAAAIAPVVAEANAALEGHDNVYVEKKLITRNDQFTSPHSDRAEGSTNNLLDGAANTFWHSDWHAGNQPAHSHYLQVALDEPVDGDVLLTFVRRNAQNDQVTLLDVETSMDGVNFAHAAYIEMPNSGAGKTEQKTFALEQKAQYFRFWADATTNNRGYWHVGDFQLSKSELDIDAPDYAYPTAVAELQQAIVAAQAVQNGTQEDVDALKAAIEVYKAALAGFPEFTEWNGAVDVVAAGEVKSLDDLLSLKLKFNRAAALEESGYGVLAAIFDETGDAYAMVFDALAGDTECEQVKSADFVGQVATLEFQKLDELTPAMQQTFKAAAQKIGGFEPAAGQANLLISAKSFLVDGEKFNVLVKKTYDLVAGTVTGVETLIANSKGEVYDLQGRRVNGLNAGLFIQNGKKVIR